MIKAKTTLDPVHLAVHAAWMTAGYAANGGVWHLIDTSSRSYLEAAVLGYKLLGESQASRSLRVVLDTFDKASAEDTPFDDYFEQHEDEIPYVEFEEERYISQFFRQPVVLEVQRAKFVIPHKSEVVVEGNSNPPRPTGQNSKRPGPARVGRALNTAAFLTLAAHEHPVQYPIPQSAAPPRRLL